MENNEIKKKIIALIKECDCTQLDSEVTSESADETAFEIMKILGCIENNQDKTTAENIFQKHYGNDRPSPFTYCAAIDAMQEYASLRVSKAVKDKDYILKQNNLDMEKLDLENRDKDRRLSELQQLNQTMHNKHAAVEL